MNVYSGPGKYDRMQFTVTFGPDYDINVTKTPLPFWKSTKSGGLVTILGDEQSGSLEVSLSSFDPTHPTAPPTQVNLTGTWHVNQPCVVLPK